MKKWFFIIGGIVIVIIIVGIIIVASNIGGIVKKAVNEYGPKITKTELRLGEVDVSIFSGSVELEDFFLGNPKGFRTPYAMKVDSIDVDVQLRSLAGDTIVINKIEIDEPDINYEKTSGTDNFQAIMNNVASTSKKEKSARMQKQSKEGPGKKIFIKDLIIKEPKVRVSVPRLNRSFKVTLPDIHLKNIGEDKGGVVPAEAVRRVVQVLYEKLTSPEMKSLLKQSLQSIRKDLESAKTPGEAGKILKGLLGN